MLQQIIVAIIFIGAAFYLGRMVYRSFQAKNGCATGCGKCGVADLEKKTKI
jgi:FeoB-associated Cys-rich membrane protein